MKPLVEKLNKTVNLNLVKKEFFELEQKYSWGKIDHFRHVFAYNSTNGQTTDGTSPFHGDESIFKPLVIFKNTYIEEIINSFAFEKGRIRFIKILPPTIMSTHIDPGPRYHLPLVTNEDSGFIDSQKQIHHMPADGHFYKLNASQPHTAFNASKGIERIHLIIVEKYW